MSFKPLPVIATLFVLGCTLWTMPSSAEGPIACPVCDQQLLLKELLFDEPMLVARSHWSDTYRFDGLEPEFDCTDGTYWDLNFQPSPEYDVSNEAWCSFSPWADPYDVGLNPYEGLCGGVSESQIDLALEYSGAWNHVAVENDQTVSIPVHYPTMANVLLGNADDVEWRYVCDLWFNPNISQTMNSGSHHGFANSNSYLSIEVPRFPQLCLNPRFEVTAPAGASARVYSIRIHRRACDPNDGEPVQE